VPNFLDGTKLREWYLIISQNFYYLNDQFQKRESQIWDYLLVFPFACAGRKVNCSGLAEMFD
jgi:hypothetical protein